jgi:hypothetical protein
MGTVASRGGSQRISACYTLSKVKHSAATVAELRHSISVATWISVLSKAGKGEPGPRTCTCTPSGAWGRAGSRARSRWAGTCARHLRDSGPACEPPATPGSGLEPRGQSSPEGSPIVQPQLGCLDPGQGIAQGLGNARRVGKAQHGDAPGPTHEA